MKQRDIVLIDVPFTDLSERKLRPALVLGIIEDDLLCCFMSSRLESKGRYDVVVKKETSNGLRVDSVVKCGKIFTLHHSLVERRLGVLSGENYAMVIKKISAIIE